MIIAYAFDWVRALQWALILLCFLPSLAWAGSAVSKRAKQRRTLSRVRDPLRNAKVYVLCTCGHPFAPSVKFGSAICPSCHHFVNVSGAQFFSLNEYDAMREEQDFMRRQTSSAEDDVAKLMQLAVFHAEKKRYAEALEYLDRVDGLPEVDPRVRDLVAALKSSYRHDLSHGR